MTTLSKLSFQDEDMGYAKRNKCHAQESMMKKKRVGHMKVQSVWVLNIIQHPANAAQLR